MELTKAVRRGDLRLVNLLLDRKAVVKAKDRFGDTPLHIVSVLGHQGIAKLLLDRKANAKTKGSNGWVPLHVAASFGHEKLTKLLLDRKANAQAKNDRGRTPLHIASRYEHEKAIKLLKSNQGRQRIVWSKFMVKNLSTMLEQGSKHQSFGLLLPFCNLVANYCE